MTFLQIAREEHPTDPCRFVSLYKSTIAGKTRFTLIAPEPGKVWTETIREFTKEEDAYEAFGEKVRKLEVRV